MSATPDSPAPHPLDERHTLPVPYLDFTPDDLYVPINGGYQLDSLVGKMLTVVDAIGLPDPQAKAVKGLARQFIGQWYAETQHNAETSYRGCLAPIVALRDTSNHTERKYVWLAEGDHAVSVT